MHYKGQTVNPLRQCNVHFDQAAGWAVMGSNPGKSEKFFSSLKRSERLGGLSDILFNRCLGLSREQSDKDVELTAYLRLVPRLINVCSYAYTFPACLLLSVQGNLYLFPPQNTKISSVCKVKNTFMLKHVVCLVTLADVRNIFQGSRIK